MFKLSCLVIALFSFTFSVQGQTVDSLVAHGMRFEKAMNESEALKQYQAAIALDSGNVEALCRASILTSREGNRQQTSGQKVPYFNKAKSLAGTALRKSADNKEANYAMALALTHLSTISGAKEKAADLKAIKTYADKALLIDSKYAQAWNILGRWNYEVSTLNFAERTALKFLFGKLPIASLGNAINDYLRCRQLDPGYIQNVYDLAMAYHANGQDVEAITTLNEAIHLRPILQDDRSIQENCRSMIQQLH
ncbi:MAG: hypothetical protein ACRDE2_08270 [Chitinophagaceae bacterium]